MPYQYAVVAVDADGDSITFALPNAPSGMSIDTRTGLLTWTPLATQLGLHAVVVEAHSDSGGVDRQGYQLSVVPAGYAPIAVAGPDQTVLRGHRVMLDGSRSRDREGALRSFSWTLVSRPAGSFATLNGATAVHPWFMADAAGEYRVQLVVGDGDLASAPDEVVIQTQNVRPVAVAGIDQVVAVGATVQLDGSGSSDADADVLRFQWSFVTVPVGSNAAFSDPSAVAPTFLADRGGSYVVRLVVNDGRVDSPADEVVIRANSPPIASAGFDRSLSFGGLVSLDGSGSHDPEQDPITYQWSLVEIPAGSTAQLSDPASRNPTFTADRVGAYVAALMVHDGLVASAPDSVRAVATNAAPLITSLARTYALRGERYQYDVDATDADPQDALTYSLQSYPAGMTIVPATGVIEWTPPAVASIDVVARVTDLGGLTSDQSFTITVLPDTVPPTVHLAVNPPIATPGQPVTLTVTGADNAGGVTFSLTVDGNVVPLDAGNQAVFTTSTLGVHPAAATATDESGNSASATDAVRVSDGSDTTGPVALLKSPDDLAEVTFLTDIIGTVSDDNFYRYELSASPADRDDYFVIGGGFAPVDSAALGTFDPTLLENGLYKVRLVAEDVNGAFAEDERVYQIEGRAKVGIFQISFVDLQVPVVGIPITVIRSYDSRVKTREDFGIGWRNEVKRGSTVSNRPPGMGWAIDDGPPPLRVPCQVTSELKSHLTEARLSDRERYTFALRVEDVHVATGLGCVATVRFAFVDGTTQGATLDVVDDFGGVHRTSDVGYQGGGYLVNYDPSSGQMGQLFNPTRFLLTAADGRKVEFNGQLGGVIRITDNNDNSVTFSATGIVHSSGRGITFARDAAGRITQITDPNGNSLRYEYNARGDLVAVVDQLANRTTFKYDARHNLVDIVDPLGNRGVRNEYDGDGHIVATIDARGNRIGIRHDLVGRQEIVTDYRGNVSVLEYDGRGNLARRTDPMGNVTLSSYDGDDRKLSETDPLGNTQSFSYDASGNLLTATDALGHVTSYTYDVTGRLLTTTNALGARTTNTYDLRGNPTTTTDALGYVQRYTYDAKGAMLTLTDAAGRLSTFSYDAHGNLAERRDPEGGTVRYVHDANGNVLSQTDRDGLVTEVMLDAKGHPVRLERAGQTTQVEYSVLGRIQTMTARTGEVTRVAYDERGQVSSVVLTDGTAARFAYEPSGKVAAETDALGNVTRHVYDALDRLTMTIFPDNSTEQRSYDAAGNLVRVVDPRGNTIAFQYDATRRRVRTIDPLGNVSTAAYDAVGRVSVATDPLGKSTTYSYDPLGRQTGTTFADGTSILYEYGAAGNVVAVIDQQGSRTVFGYDVLGRLTSTVDALGNTTRYEYDMAGNRTAAVNANGHRTTLAYDTHGRLLSTQYPMGGVESVTYELGGRVATRTNGNGATVGYSYDALGRLTQVRMPDAARALFTHTADGLVATVADSQGTTRYEYHPSRRWLTRAIEPDGRYVRYVHDAAGNVTLMAHGMASSVDEHVTTYTYDGLNRVASVTDAAGGVTAYSYDAQGRNVETRRANETTTSQAFDDLGRLLALTHRGPDGGVIESFRYRHDVVGNRAAVTHADGSQVEYAHDATGRLVGERHLAADGAVLATSSYTYDAVGNIIARGGSSGSSINTYNMDDQLVTSAGMAFGYDAAGNLLSTTDSLGSVTRYSYDALGRLAMYENAAGAATTYSYDVRSARRGKYGADGAVRYLTDHRALSGFPQVVRETDASGATRRSFVHGRAPLSRVEAGIAGYYHADGLGSIRHVTDSAGLPLASYTYSAYGEALGTGAGDAEPYRFAGEQRDVESGLYYLRSRYYQPRAGRFLSRDPAPGRDRQPITLNKYLYANANPTDLVDPSGEVALRLGGFEFSLTFPEAGSALVVLPGSTGRTETATPGWSDMAMRSQAAVRMAKEYGSIMALHGAIAAMSQAPEYDPAYLGFFQSRQQIARFPAGPRTVRERLLEIVCLFGDPIEFVFKVVPNPQNVAFVETEEFANRPRRVYVTQGFFALLPLLPTGMGFAQSSTVVHEIAHHAGAVPDRENLESEYYWPLGIELLMELDGMLERDEAIRNADSYRCYAQYWYAFY